MSFDKLKDLESRVSALQTQLDEVKSAPKEKVITDEKVDAKEIQTRAANAYIFKRITGRDLKDEVLETRAINPADLPNWLAEQFHNDLIERMSLLANVEGMFREYKLPSGVASLSIPKKRSAIKAYRIAPSQDAINSALQSEKVTFATEALMTLVPVSDQANDESYVAILEEIKDDIARSLVDGLENVIINGDTTAGDTNINGSAVGADGTAQERLFDGLIKITNERDASLPSKLDFGGALTLENFVALRKLMGKEGVHNRDLVYIVSPVTFHNLVTAIPEMVTVDKYGAKATVVTGEVAKIAAVPVVVSEFIPEDLDATGAKADDGDKTMVLLVNKSMFALATRGTATYENDRRIENRTNIFTGFRDVDFKELTGGLGIVASTLGYNLPK